jgi:hypothetical protein
MLIVEAAVAEICARGARRLASIDPLLPEAANLPPRLGMRRAPGDERRTVYGIGISGLVLMLVAIRAAVRILRHLARERQAETLIPGFLGRSASRPSQKRPT